jgi:hypothetical protein
MGSLKFSESSIGQQGGGFEDIKRLHEKEHTRSIFWLHLKTLMKRDVKGLIRDPKEVRVRVLR